MVAVESFSVKVWHKSGGGMMTNTSCLSISHPMHPYNQVKNAGLIPEEYGLEHPHVAEFKDKTHSQLVDEIVELRSELNGMLKAGF